VTQFDEESDEVSWILDSIYNLLVIRESDVQAQACTALIHLCDENEVGRQIADKSIEKYVLALLFKTDSETLKLASLKALGGLTSLDDTS